MDLISRLKSYEAQSTGPRRYALTHHALERLERHLATLVRGGQPIHTCETGCGSSTVAFSHYAASHVAYCDIDEDSATADLAFVRTHPEFRPDVVSFVLGATTENLFTVPSSTEIDVLLLNGSHAYPVPDLEYVALERCLKPQGILALSDIRVPTVKHLFDFLVQDESFRLHQLADSSAFFIRLSKPALHGSRDWRDQRYNRLFYPAHNWHAYSVGYSLPCSITFEGGQRILPSILRSGFKLLDGRPVMEGSQSTIVLPLDRKVSGDVEVTLGIGITTNVRPEINLFVHWEGQSSTSRLGTNQHHIITTRAHLHDVDRIRMTLAARCLNGAELPKHPSDHAANHPFFPNLVITDIGARQPSEKPRFVQGQRITRTDGAIVRFNMGAEEFQFFVVDPDDSIQSHHVVGQIYELEELALMARHVRPGFQILDVGANIGNHAIWFEKSLRAARVVVVEPQASAISLLKINCLLNNTRCIDQSFLGVALGRENGRGRIEIAERYNAAGGRLVLDESGVVDVLSGDHMLGDMAFDFIKIDVEGAELDVLAGMARLIERCKPTIFVEVWDEGREAFQRYAGQIGYGCVEEFRRYDVCSNLLLKPRTAGD